MTQRELVALMRSYRTTACEWANTVEREVFDNGRTFTDSECIHHRRFLDAVNSYIEALDRFISGLRAFEDSDDPCSRNVEEIVRRGFANSERQFRARPTITKKPARINPLW